MEVGSRGEVVHAGSHSSMGAESGPPSLPGLTLVSAIASYLQTQWLKTASVNLLVIRGSEFGEGWVILPLHGVLSRSLGWLHLPVAGLGWKVLEVPLTGLALQVAVLSTGSLGFPHSMVALSSGSRLIRGSVPGGEGRSSEGLVSEVTRGHFCILLVRLGHRPARIQGRRSGLHFLTGSVKVPCASAREETTMLKLLQGRSLHLCVLPLHAPPATRSVLWGPVSCSVHTSPRHRVHAAFSNTLFGKREKSPTAGSLKAVNIVLLLSHLTLSFQ